MKNRTIGFAFCGSFCTYQKAISALKQLVSEYSQVIPIFSRASMETDSRFGTAMEHRQEIARKPNSLLSHILQSMHRQNSLLDV